MITSLKDSEGKIIAYCEWRLVGQSGLEVPCGEYVWINDCWIHPSVRFRGGVNRIIDELMREAPTANYGYFQRKDVNDKVHIWSRRQWERRRMEYSKLNKGKV